MSSIMSSSSNNLVYHARADNTVSSLPSLVPGRPCTSSPLTLMSSSSDQTALDMKDVTVSSSRSSRSTAYPKKRPSPHGIFKTRKLQQASPNASSAVACRSPHALKMQREQQRQQQQLVVRAAVTLCKESPQMEEEYREEVQNYMYQMEVSTLLYSLMSAAPDYMFRPRTALYHGINFVYGPTARD